MTRWNHIETDIFGSGTSATGTVAFANVGTTFTIGIGLDTIGPLFSIGTFGTTGFDHGHR